MRKLLLLRFAKLVGLATLAVLAVQVLRWGWPDTLEAELASWGLYLLVCAAWIRGENALEDLKKARRSTETTVAHMLREKQKDEERHAQVTQGLVSSLGASKRKVALQAGVIEQQRSDLAQLLVAPEEVLEALESAHTPHFTAFVTAWQHSREELRAVLRKSQLYRSTEAELLARKLNIYRGNK